MLDKLTDAQLARIAEYRDKWIAIGLSTEPACREKAENAIKRMYSSAGLSQPRKILWCGSPLSQGLTRAIIVDKKIMTSVRNSVWNSVGASVRDSVRASVRASVGTSVGASVRNSVRASVWASVGVSVRASVRGSAWASVRDSVWNSAWASVWDSVGASVRNSVWASVGASLKTSVGASVEDSGYGQHDANWLAFYEFFRDVVGLNKETKKLTGHFEQAKAAGWYLPHKSICWVSERHNVLVRDERGRLHCESGPAVAYPDGWKIYAWHGVRVPETVIEQRDRLTVQQIVKERNTEVRRVMRNLYGTARFLKDAGAIVISEAPTHGAKLLSFRLEGDPEDIKMLELTCPSTGSVYHERVRPEINDCMEALVSRIHVKPSEYEPVWET